MESLPYPPVSVVFFSAFFQVSLRSWKRQEPVVGQQLIYVAKLPLCYTYFKVTVVLLRFQHRGPTQSVCVANCYFIVNVLDLPFASPIAIYR